jgi:Na+-transporting methylmalonyl-CoA/oxaloacetate decarboxylase gamma subunit
MKKILLILIAVMSLCGKVMAQQDRNERREDRKEMQDEKIAKNKNKVDYNVFRRQILALPEYAEQRSKLQEIRKASKGIPKINAVVDSTNDSDDTKLLTGYIVLTLGDNTANVYEVTYDRSLKKITQVKPTGETLDIDKEDATEQKNGKNLKKPAPKKKKSDEDEEENEVDEDEEEKPARGKKKTPKDEDD